MPDRRILLPDFVARRFKRDEAQRLIEQVKTTPKPKKLPSSAHSETVARDVGNAHQAKTRKKRRAANKRARRARRVNRG